ncbi:MAG: glycine--tRNA ligase subunit beta [Rhodobacteraceae bacterium]|nr:glycine--tRNA ligase subunit beta [Paracoccaceae bacterium]
MPDLLLELFSEEIPARMQDRASADLKRLVTQGLVDAGITYEAAAAFATPRRLALSVTGLLAASPALREERKGPRVDAPEQALAGFLRATGLAREQLEIRDDKKGQTYFAVIEKPGRAAGEVAAEVIEATIRNFPWPKSMRWGAGSLRWVRPLHSILCILSDAAGVENVALEVDGIKAGDTTEGHRFMGGGRFAVTSFDDYAARLKRNHVILDAEDRAAMIEADARNLAFAQGMDLVEDAGLLAEVAGLVEWPVVLMGDIAPDFFGLPAKVLQTSMKAHQKFFSVRNPKTGGIEKFITVANRETADHGATILAGNRKVLFARLSDARFFWENDLRTVRAVGLEGMGQGLADVTFHNKLGSQADRVKRIEALAREIAPLVGAAPDLAAEAARIAKADLQSEMVAEFPELQGLMGMYYAREAYHNDGVPEACAEHYAPLGPNDNVPSAPVSVAVALADKIDTLTGFWAIDEKPTGSKDPFALRRAALGVIRLVLANQVRAGLVHTIAEARNNCDANDLLAFLHDRLKVHLKDQGIRHDVIDACLAMPGNDDLTLLVNRATALAAFLKTDDGENLLQGYKRANNILAQAEARDGVSYEGAPEVRFAEDATETALFGALDAAEPAIAAYLEAEDFAAAMAAMAALRAPIDAFFEAVQINADNQIVRRNRLCLLNRIREVMGQAAQFSAIEG